MRIFELVLLFQVRPEQFLETVRITKHFFASFEHFKKKLTKSTSVNSIGKTIKIIWIIEKGIA